MRGKPIISSCKHFELRITPACAGKTMVHLERALALRDHPRVCGENRDCGKLEKEYRGSPPRVRGKHRASYCKTHLKRITPACAGKTLRVHRLAARQGDHPRVCGENACANNLVRDTLGSPPRVRGKLRKIHRMLAAQRITPACAGKTQAGCGHRKLHRDHPRVCGEN